MPLCVADFDGIGRSLFSVTEVRERIFDLKGPLILPEIGSPAPDKTQGCCILNQDLLMPFVKAMRAAKSLALPATEQIYCEVEQLWMTYFLFKQKKKSAKGSGRYPKLDPQFKIPDDITAHAWSDAKSIKKLLGFLRRQLLSQRVAKDSQLNNLLTASIRVPA